MNIMTLLMTFIFFAYHFFYCRLTGDLISEEKKKYSQKKKKKKRKSYKN